MKLEKLNYTLTNKMIAERKPDYQNRNGGDPQPGIPLFIEVLADEELSQLLMRFDFIDTSPSKIIEWVKAYFNEHGIEGSNLDIYPGGQSRYKNHYNIAEIAFKATFKKQQGGKRYGSGPKPIHTNPDEKERTKKYRATDPEWERFKKLIPSNSRTAFLLILDLLEKNAKEQ